MIKRVTISDKALEASIKLAELIARNMNSHIIGEQLVGPACLAIFKTMLGIESKDFISKVPLPSNTISR